MKRKKILAGNWKMNLDYRSALELANQITQSNSNITHILIPPTLYIPEVARIASQRSLFTGAQNCSSFSSGAYTGEISAGMIKSCGADYCLVGHSERRTLFGEKAAEINKKIAQCIGADLQPIICIGENLEERKSEKHFEIVSQQITEAISGFDKTTVSKMIFAYEPVWAIGTGLTASPEQAQEVHFFIRNRIKELYNSEISESVPILYGGSCNSKNAVSLFACSDVDGGLIGSASLKADEFEKISESFPV